MPDNYLDAFAGLTNDMSEDELAVFKRVFLSEDGQFVLQRIMEKCKFMEPCENERDMALNNFAKDLIATVYWDRNTQRTQMYRIIEFIKRRSRLKRNS